MEGDHTWSCWLVEFETPTDNPCGVATAGMWLCGKCCMGRCGTKDQEISAMMNWEDLIAHAEVIMGAKNCKISKLHVFQMTKSIILYLMSMPEVAIESLALQIRGCMPGKQKSSVLSLDLSNVMQERNTFVSTLFATPTLLQRHRLSLCRNAI